MDSRLHAPWVESLQVQGDVPVCRPLLPSVERLLPYLARIDESRRYSNHGQLVLELQERLSSRLSGHHVALASSGTAAIVGATLAAAGPASPERPICLMPAYTFIGTVSAVEQCGYEPHFVDVDETSWQICPLLVREHPLLPRTGLVVAVSAFGRKLEQHPWEAFQAATGVPVVIDGAAMIDAMFSDPAACIGSIPVALSFHATKAFATGEGGAVVCASEALWKAAMQALNFGYDVDRLSKRPAINGKISEYHAAVGLAELDGWEGKAAAFRQAAAFLRRSAPGDAALFTGPDVGSSYALLQMDSAEEADLVSESLDAAGIGWRRWYGLGAHAHPYTARFGRDRLEISEYLARTTLGLPMSVDLTEREADRIAEALGSGLARSTATALATAGRRGGPSS